MNHLPEGWCSWSPAARLVSHKADSLQLGPRAASGGQVCAEAQLKGVQPQQGRASSAPPSGEPR